MWNLPRQEMAKVNQRFHSQWEEDEHDKQIVYDTMYKTRWSLFQALHTTLQCGKTIQNVRKPVSDFYYRYRRDVVIKLLHRLKRLFSFQNKQFLYFLTNV